MQLGSKWGQIQKCPKELPTFWHRKTTYFRRNMWFLWQSALIMIPLILDAPHFAGGVHFQFMGCISSLLGSFCLPVALLLIVVQVTFRYPIVILNSSQLRVRRWTKRQTSTREDHANHNVCQGLHPTISICKCDSAPNQYSQTSLYRILCTGNEGDV